MLMAQLRGKLPSEVWQTSEDLLTSAVFGTLKNLPPALTAELLSKATPVVGSICPRLVPAAWEFWPWWDTCEPDVVIADGDAICVIEAKLYAEFGEDTAAGTQLAREWSDGVRRSMAAGKQFWLVAVTNHATVPEQAIRKQLEGSDANLSRVCRLSWQQVGRVVAAEPASGWHTDLLDLLAQMGMAPFRGFGEVVQQIPKTALSRLPWCGRPLLRVEAPPAAGFGVVLRLSRVLRGESACTRRFSGGRNEAVVGFERAWSRADRWRRRGGGRWCFAKT